MSYTKINWQNDAVTPLNADNLNHMDDEIYRLSTITGGSDGSGVNRVLIDPFNGNDSTGVVNDDTMPFRTLDYVLNELHTNILVEIFIKGNVIVAQSHRLNNAKIIIYALDDGSHDPSASNYTVAFDGDAMIQVNGSSSCTFFVNCSISQNANRNTVFYVGTNSSAFFGGYRVADFNNSITQDGYVGYARESDFTLNKADFLVMFGANASITVKSTDVIYDTSIVGSNPTFFGIINDTYCGIRNQLVKINGADDPDKSIFTSLFTGIKSANSVVYNVIAGYYIDPSWTTADYTGNSDLAQ
jgi:hypothetical protein